MYLLGDTVKKYAKVMEPPEETAAKLTIADYLQSWGLEIYIEKFIEHFIDLETLQMLSDADLRDLVPVIGHRAKLSTQIKLLNKIMSNAFTTTPLNQELYKILNSSNEGKGLLLQYEKQGLLNNAARRRLCHIIIDNELKNDPEKKF